MKNIIFITKKELSIIFLSPLAYITLSAFLLINGWFFSAPLFIVNQASLQSLFNTIPLIFIVFIPAITMSTISKEKNSETIELLLTMPLTKYQIILGKYFSSLIFIFVGIFFTLVHFFTIYFLGTNIDFGQIIFSYFSLILLAGVYSAIGIYSSTLSKNQIVAFLISFFIIFFFYIITRITLFFPPFIGEFFMFLGIELHLSNLLRGILDTRDLIYFLSLIVAFLVLATNKLEKI